MRSLAITSALAALSLITGAAAAVLARQGDVIVDFDIFYDANCDLPDEIYLYRAFVTDGTIDDFKSGPSCNLFHDLAGNPTDVGGVALTVLRDGYELDVYPDADCQEGPAIPVLGQCVWNAGRFKAFSLRFNGEPVSAW